MNTRSQAGAFDTLGEVQSLSLSSFAPRVEPSAVLMCEPKFFQVQDSKNEFMQGNIGAVDLEKAHRQWNELKRTYERLGFPVKLVAPVESLEDMVFAANQALPFLRDGKPYVLMAHMAFASRRREIPFYRRWFEQAGYGILELPKDNPPCFEGQGDAVWHPSRQLLWLGFGNRTEEPAGQILSDQLDVTVLKLKLATSKFYHLDTAFAALDEDSVMIYAPAFEARSLDLIRHFFKNVIEVEECDANNFACNALALGRNVILQKGSKGATAKLKQFGFTPIEVETSEFIKSGGSVFCLKLVIY